MKKIPAMPAVTMVGAAAATGGASMAAVAVVVAATVLGAPRVVSLGPTVL